MTTETACTQQPSRLGLANRAAAATLLALAIAVLSGPPADAASAVKAVRIGTFQSPVYIASAPKQPRLLFIVEKAGLIQVLQDEQPLETPFLDIRNLVLAGGERGLLSMAFRPDYHTSGRFYVAYTNKSGAIEVDEFRRMSHSATLASRTSRRILLRIPHSGAANHNGGQLQFGPVDELLYISTGDGGNVQPHGEPARRLNSLLGKILRIDPRPTANRPYRIPESNPFVGRGGRDEIYAYGLRNPWRFSFDRQRIAIADVGQNRREEVNFLLTEDAAGVNFGWPQFEGNVVFDNNRPGPDPAKPPMLVYNHNGGRCAIIGGYVVRDPNLPTLLGRYLYGDLCTGKLRSFVPKVLAQRADDDKAVGITAPGLSAFGKGHGKVMYFAQVNGAVSRLAPR